MIFKVSVEMTKKEKYKIIITVAKPIFTIAKPSLKSLHEGKMYGLKS